MDVLLVGFDMLLRVFGIILALGVAGSVVGSSLRFSFLLYDYFWRRNLLMKIAGLPVCGVFLAIYTYSIWRMFRFMGGYTGSSEYPFHFVVFWRSVFVLISPAPITQARARSLFNK